MGWSCLQAQSKTLTRLHEWEKKQPNWTEKDPPIGTVFFEFEHGHKDYGTPEAPNMRLSVMEHVGNNVWRNAGEVFILADGSLRNCTRVGKIAQLAKTINELENV